MKFYAFCRIHAIAILLTKAEYRSSAGYAFESKRAFFMESLKVAPKFLTSADVLAATRQGRPAPRITHGWLRSTADAAVFQVSELDEPGSQIR